MSGMNSQSARGRGTSVTERVLHASLARSARLFLTPPRIGAPPGSHSPVKRTGTRPEP